LADVINFIAGRRAAEIIRDEGLNTDRIRVVVGAAGGPKFLVLGGIDRALFGTLFKKRKKPLFLVGSSIGAWRFTALSRKSQVRTLDRFRAAYLTQSYQSRPSPHEVSLESKRILDEFLEDRHAGEVLSHPYVRLNLLSVRSKLLFATDSRPILAAGMACASLGNLLSRKSLGLFFDRALFYDPRDFPPFFNIRGFPISRIPLTSENLKPAVMASGSIPLVMEGTTSIPGAPEGLYRDGGLIDYHPSLAFDPEPGRIVLYPHYTNEIIPGWLDKRLPGRRADKKTMENVMIVCPSRSFISRLPYGKIPDRDDFKRFLGRERERLAYWNRVVDLSEKLEEELLEAVESKKIKKMVRDY
jgi:hypothetical protein